MRFLCQIYVETPVDSMSVVDAARQFGEYAAFTEGIRRSGHYVDANRLLPPATACTVRVRDGKVSTTDGPFAETKECVGGYYVIDARDLNEAIRIAAKIPGARAGAVEVRPIADDSRTRRTLAPAPQPLTTTREKEMS